MMCTIIKHKYENELRMYAIYNLVGCFGLVVGMLLSILLKEVDIIVLISILSIV